MFDNLEHLGDGQHAVALGVVDGVLADLIVPFRQNQRRRAAPRRRRARGDGERLHRRAGLEGVGDGAVARALRLGGAGGSFGLKSAPMPSPAPRRCADPSSRADAALAWCSAAPAAQRALGDTGGSVSMVMHDVVPARAGASMPPSTSISRPSASRTPCTATTCRAAACRAPARRRRGPCRRCRRSHHRRRQRRGSGRSGAARG